MPNEVRLTASWSFIRFHHGTYGAGFGRKELSVWARRIRTFAREGADVFVYFNNDAKGYAIRDGKRLREMVGKLAT